MLTQLLKTTAIAAALTIGGMQTARAATITELTLGDTTKQPIFNNASPSLQSMLNDNGIFNSSGQIDPYNDQTQWQMFTVTEGAADFSLELIGSSASFNNNIGVFTAPLANPTNFTKQHACTNNVDPNGTTFNFTVASDYLFGFFLEANGNAAITYSSVNAYNPDNTGTLTTDHMLAFETLDGWVIAFEDLPFNSNTGKMGDQDYNDVVFTVQSAAIPEPASAALILLGGACLLGRPRRRKA